MYTVVVTKAPDAQSGRGVDTLPAAATEIYRQSFDELDMPALMATCNGLKLARRKGESKSKRTPRQPAEKAADKASASSAVPGYQEAHTSSK